MIPESCLLTYFILNDTIESSCDFIKEKIFTGNVFYEVLRVINSKPLFYNEHIERFMISIESSEHEFTLSRKSITKRIKALILSNKIDEGNIRFQVSFSTNSQPVFSAWVTPYFYPGKQLYMKGASLSTTDAQRKNPNVKIYNPNLKNNISALLKEKGVYEILLINQKGLITEGSRSNIFFIKEKSIFTPLSSSVLPGITRLKVLDIANKLNIDCKEVDIPHNSLESFCAAFVTGTSPKVLPVKNIDKVLYNPSHPIIHDIKNEYKRLVNEDIADFIWDSFTNNE